MEKKTLIEWLNKQPVWIKIVIGVAATVIMAWGVTGCTAQVYMQRKGFHQDSVNYWMKIDPRKANIM